MSQSPADFNSHQFHAHLREADIKTLLMVLVTYTHDEELLEECRPYIQGPWDYMENIPPQLREKILLRVESLLAEIYSGERKRKAAPPTDLLEKMMATYVGQPLSHEYIQLVMEHFGFFGARPSDDVTISTEKTRVDDFRVAIVGAGMSGICAAIKLKEAGIPFVIFEKNDHVGGTWYENSYPGAGVDTPNHLYSFTFEPNHDWSEYFAKRDELFAYFDGVARKYGVHDVVEFKTTVTAATYVDDRSMWKLKVTSSDGSERIVEVNAVLFGVGFLNRPSIPSIAGLESFTGPVLHTAQWDSSVSLEGKRVAMVGTGASGMQVGPTIAPAVKHLTIFQRSPHWVTSNPNYHRKVTEGKKWALKHIPYYADWYRFQLFWATADGLHASLHVDPSWPHLDRSLNEANERMRQTLIASIRTQIGDDDELLAKCIPNYPPYGKRMLRDNHWYATLKRDNVELVTQPIDHIEPKGIVTANGEVHGAEILVLATGFSVGQVLGPIEVHGSEGVDLRSIWGEDDPRAYLGLTVPGFPNLFILAGPNTNPAHGGSAMFHAECQVAYAVQAIRLLANGEYVSLDVKKNVHDDYNERIDLAHAGMVWAHEGVTSWYKNKAGRVFGATPWRMVDYWKWLRRFDPQDYNCASARKKIPEQSIASKVDVG